MIQTITNELSAELTAKIDRVGPNVWSVRLECFDLRVLIAQKRVMWDSNFLFEGGQHVQISGLNGSGKSTLLGILSGLIDPSAGTCRISIAGHNADRSKDLSYTPQYPLIFHGMTVSENLALIARQSIKEISEALRDPNLRQRLPGTLAAVEKFCGGTSSLSTGQQRILLFLASALSRAKIILMDEPYAGLAEEISSECRAEAKRWAFAGKLVIVAEPVRF